MNKKTIFLITVIFLSFLIVVNPINKVKADTGYNLVDNYSFDDAVGEAEGYETLLPNGFQNTTDDFTEYQAFPYIDTFDDLTGVGCTSSSEYMEHFTFENLPSDVALVNNVSLIVRAHYSGSSGTMRTWLWDEDSDDWHTENQWGLTAVFQNITDDFSSIFPSVSYVNNAILKFGCVGGVGGIFIDAVCLVVGVTYSGSGQTTITTTTEPWYTDSIISYDGEISDTYAYEGLYSYRSKNSPYVGVNQYLTNGYYGDNITEVSLYALTNNPSGSTIKFGVSYAGYYTLENSQSLTGDSAWHKISFELGYIIKSGRIIDGLEINIVGSGGYYTYIDNVVINSTVPTDNKAIEWSITPTPYSTTRQSFVGYQGIEYHFTFLKYSYAGDLTENGTVSIASTLSVTQSVNMTNGLFSFDLPERNGLTDVQERIDISITSDEGVYLVTLMGTYLADSSSTPNPTDPDTVRAGDLIDWIIMFMIIFLPALLLAGGLYENNQQPDSMHISPMFGIVAGLFLSVGLGIFTGLVPLWLMVVLIVAVAILMVGMIRH